MTLPYWNQNFTSTSNQIPMQAYVGSNSPAVKFECSPAYHGGLYPAYGPYTWTPIASVTPSSMKNYDVVGGYMFSASLKATLPAGCWRQDPAYSSPTYFAAIRAQQGTTTSFLTYDKPGLECLGVAVGGKSWGEAYSSGCETAANYTIIRIVP